ncbi:MAG TPA: glycoside hydrolase family 25 protein [Candidatus Limnocylindrales bacterium]
MTMHRSPRARRSIAGLAGAWIAALIAATVLAPVAAADSSGYIANCDVNLRATPASAASVLAVITTGTLVVSGSLVAGDAWSANCATNVAGSTWLAITSVGGKSATSLYGVATVYAASGLFRSAAWLEGVDVSHYQGTIDFAKVAAAGKSFVIAKATEGIGYTDPNWTKNLAAATAAGLRVTGYHFARPDGNPTKPVQEADWFVSQLQLAPGMVVPALDLERSGGMSPTALQAWVGAWLGEVYAKTGVRPMIYTSPSFWHTALNNTSMFADQGYTVLWIAHWFVGKPSVPANNWGNHSWTFWQYDDCGKVPGISGCVDLDRFNGLDMTRVIVGADFNLGTSPAQRSVEQGAGTQFTIPISRTFFTLPIALKVTGLPTGAQASLDPATNAGSTATLSITAATGASAPPAGSYPVVVTGTANGLTRSTTATLVVTDAAPPTVSPPATRLYYRTTLGISGATILTGWTAADPSGVAQDELQLSTAGGAWSGVGLPTATTTSVTQYLIFGTKYRYQARATDGVANTSSWALGPAVTPLLTQQSSASVTYGGTWHSATSSSASGGSLKYTYARGAWAQLRFTGSSIAWVAAIGPSRGSAYVYIDGVLKGSISLNAASSHARQIVYAYNWSTNGVHSIKIVDRATSGHPRIDVDAFLRLVQG